MKKLVVVGGGSAGWIAAAYLHGALNQQGREKNVDIHLVESPDIPRISVGEATVPAIQHILKVVGIDELAFMKATDASFKQSIKYVNWVQNDNSHYHHPFSRLRVTPLDKSGERWLKSDRKIPFMETVSTQPLICEMGLAPKVAKPRAQTPLSYAYHMNAQKFADYLRDVSVSRGLTHTLANLVSVQKRGDQHIQSVTLSDGQILEADLFVDCTGFKGLLMKQQLGAEYQSLAQYLLCDRAVTMHIPYESHYPGEIRPYTTATALSNGWIWDIPMNNQRSVGYVHSSHFIDKEQAEREMRSYQGDDTDQLASRFVDFQVGTLRKHWIGNCLAIGLAGGFIEPLESTGLYLADLGAVLLAEHFPDSAEDMPLMAGRYNRLMRNRYFEILDFINMHYCLTKRTDTEFWRTVQMPEHINDRLKAKLDYWKRKPPSASDFQDQWWPGMLTSDSGMADTRPLTDTAGIWNHESYECILYGMHFGEQEYNRKYGEQRPPLSVNPELIQRLQAARQSLPRHSLWLQQMLGAKQYPLHKKPAGWN